MRVPAARRCALRGILLRGDVRIDIDFQSVVGFVAWIKLENFERNGDEEENRDDSDDADDDARTGIGISIVHKKWGE